MSEKLLKIIGTAILPEDLEKGHDYSVGLIVNITERTEKIQDDGTEDILFKARMCGPIVIQKDFGKKIFGKLKVSPSKKLRQRLWMIWSEKEEGDFDAFYEKAMNKIISNVEDYV